jgi:hypothetical protein
MKKLYFLNEEESNRILNLHKDATKRQYLKEDDNSKTLSEQSDMKFDRQSNAIMNAANIRSKEDYNTVNSVTNKAAIEGGNWMGGILGMPDYTKFNGVAQTPTPEVQTPTPEVKKPVKSAPNPLVMDIQRKLIEKKIDIGKTGDKRDGVDGVIGKKTLNGIISLLGGANTAAATSTVSAETAAAAAATTTTTTVALVASVATKDVNPED